MSTLDSFLGSCPPTQPLQTFLRIPSDSTVEQDPSSSSHLGPNMPRRVHFDDTYENPPIRPRRPSWHSGIPSTPFLPTPHTPGRDRRQSFEGVFIPLQFAAPRAGISSNFQIHPLLNGEAFRTDFYFDLALPSFSPLRWVGPGQSTVLSADELHELATYPSIMRMRISHEAIRQWPIDLEFHYDQHTVPTTPPPIMLGDVLYTIHTSLHKRITHQDWARLGLSEEIAIARAYTRRCRSSPEEARKGVKRIDYLLDKHLFKGLIGTHDEDGLYHWRLITV